MPVHQSLTTSLQSLKVIYDRGKNPLESIGSLAAECIEILEKNAIRRFQGSVGSTKYDVFLSDNSISRPIRNDLYFTKKYDSEWKSLIGRISNGEYFTPEESVRFDKTIYSTITSISSVYDIWQNASRKVPGTFYEIVTGSLLSSFYPECKRSKHIQIPSDGRVATDIVLTSEKTGKGLVLPVKITTRERIVQPFAHQRILFSVFGEKYHSILVCVSEVQRASDKDVNQICVPGTIKLFSKYLAKMDGIVYLDPPARYVCDDITAILPVKSFSALFTELTGKILR